MSDSTAEAQAEAQARKKMAEMLRRGDKVKVDQNGNILPADASASQNAINIPKGTLAAGFYWYENDIELLNGEKIAMSKHFPQFQLGKLDDGKLYWFGSLSPGLFKRHKPWFVWAVYQHNHPNNSSYGGSVRVYSLDPDLEEFRRQNNNIFIPHTLSDDAGHIYLCTANPEDVQAGSVVTTAASSLAWAVKWIAAFELWVEGELSTEEFGQHRGI
jgi:hypothetical protein